jgi:NADPH-dependent 2,4-dienoyl-CoA reductase/sulfur reductase-like enzyme
MDGKCGLKRGSAIDETSCGRGGGAAGLMAAISAAENGAAVLVLEKCRRRDGKF